MDTIPGPPATAAGNEVAGGATAGDEHRKDAVWPGADANARQGSRRRRGSSAKPRRSSGAKAAQGHEESADQGQDWHGFDTGQLVDVHLPDGFSFHGTVDAKTSDSGVIWIRSDAGTRRMFGHLEGVRLARRTAAGGTPLPRTATAVTSKAGTPEPRTPEPMAAAPGTLTGRAAVP
ncbi:hypothetical protein [Arthrobacter sp. Leaf137]|uniref:hypothetical protein n=1 Tax=Arthrobacter sp. Leaf137 TaxID=1736271 RepID=UPI0006F68DEB|nr:hypothetical protein [Arthrobacter sp. Leaf137]KQQ82423.1 hypothetical protein ASF64_10630 [Arthrobacter sp. Leaf137]